MRIMFLDSIEKETWGGMEEWIRLAADGLSKRGHTVTVAGRRDAAFLSRLEKSIPAIDLLPLDIGGDFHPVTIAAIKRELENRQIDVLLVNFTKDIRLGGLAARFEGAVRVVWSVGLDITKDSWSHRWLTPKLVDGVIVPSAALRNQITRLGYINSELVTVIPIGIDRTVDGERTMLRAEVRKRLGIDDDIILGVTVGRFVEQKGHTHLIEAVLQAKELPANVRFLLLGDGPLQETLDRQMTEAGVRSRFIFGGMVNNVSSVLPGADFMVHPSIEEPFGIALAEGMRAGLAIVATNVGGIQEVVDNSCAVLVPPKSPLALAEAILGLSRSGERRSELGMNGQRRFEQLFTADKMIDRLEQYLSTLLNSERGHGQTKTA